MSQQTPIASHLVLSLPTHFQPKTSKPDSNEQGKIAPRISVSYKIDCLSGFIPFAVLTLTNQTISSLARLDSWISIVVQNLITKTIRGSSRQKQYVDVFRKLLQLDTNHNICTGCGFVDFRSPKKFELQKHSTIHPSISENVMLSQLIGTELLSATIHPDAKFSSLSRVNGGFNTFDLILAHSKPGPKQS